MKIGQSILLRYPVDRNFCRNHFIPHDLGDGSNLKFFHSKIENGRHFWKEEKLLKTEQIILHTVNDLFSAQCAKQSLFLFNICWEKMSLLAHPS